jgi:voltage-gated potassium channel
MGHCAPGTTVDRDADGHVVLPGLPAETGRTAGPYSLFIAALSGFALLILGLQAAIADERAREVLATLDTFVCVVFLIDFALTLKRERQRWRYMLSWGWIDLLSSIPTVSFLRVGRAARVARVLRVLRGLRATRTISRVLLQNRSQSTALAAFLVALVVVAFSSIAVLHVEGDAPEANIRTADDALWWSVTTLTTVGYGDRFPVSAEGRAIAMVLMAAGVGLFGTFSATLAAWFIDSREDESNEELKRLSDEVRMLRLAISNGQAATSALGKVTEEAGREAQA